MTRIRTFKSAVFALLCLVPVAAMAQPPITVTLTGKVTDSQNNALRDAVVMVKTGNNLLAHARALTDAQGNFGQFRAAAHQVENNGQAVLVVRKAGYLPYTRNINGFSEDVGTIDLQRDPIENRIDSVMAMMNRAEKIGQMTQPLVSVNNFDGGVTSAGSGTAYLYGSVLRGGDGHAANFLSNMVTTLNSWPAGRARIPVWYGKDAVHGNAGIPGYTVFPHNIGLGATRDSALVRRIGEATAKEMWAAGIDMNFSPAISVALDPRWGRTYESYGENPELHVQMGAAMVRGLQGENFTNPWGVTSIAKHFLADGGTTGGRDRGETSATDEVLRAIHLPGYEAVVEQGVLGVMASFNTIRGVHQHIDSVRMTGWLKTELGFDGFIISDWQGIANSNTPGFTDPGNYGGGVQPTLTREDVRKAINAGIDLAMEPGSHSDFITHLTALVNSGEVSEARIDDAVRRILRAKFRAGRMDNWNGPNGYVRNTANRAHADHRAIAREAVRKSLVLLKNADSALPLAKNARIHVFGSHHNDIGLQCGGWTIAWQGVSGNSGGGGLGGTPQFNFTTYGASIYQGMQSVAGTGAALSASANGTGTGSGNADVIVYITGERPYAEWHGDIPSTNFPSLNFVPPAADMTTLANHRAAGRKIVTVFVTGRPRIVPELLNASDAFVVAWLPGTEGAGVADVLFGDHDFTGKLPITWSGSGNTTQFPYGFGLTYSPVTSIAEAVREIPSNSNQDISSVLPPAVSPNQFTAGPNPVDRLSGAIAFFWQGRGINKASLAVYDATGNFVRRITINDPAGTTARRQIGTWNLRDRRGRPVADGSYIIKGTITAIDGKKEIVSLIVGVR